MSRNQRLYSYVLVHFDSTYFFWDGPMHADIHKPPLRKLFRLLVDASYYYPVRAKRAQGVE